MILFIQILSVLVIWLSFWSLIPRDEWWIRGADFPRLQILIIGFIALGLYIFWEHSWTLIDQIIFVGLVADTSLPVEDGFALYLNLEKTGEEGQTAATGSKQTNFFTGF